MSNYEIVNDDIKNWINDIIEEMFPHLIGTTIEVIYKTKKQMSKGFYSLSKLVTPKPMEKYLFELSNNNELDYILLLDMEVFNYMEDIDRKLMISHALEYANVDLDKKNPYGLRGAEVETFYDEIDRNREDALWQQRHQDIAASIYTKEE